MSRTIGLEHFCAVKALKTPRYPSISHLSSLISEHIYIYMYIPHAVPIHLSFSLSLFSLFLYIYTNNPCHSDNPTGVGRGLKLGDRGLGVSGTSRRKSLRTATHRNQRNQVNISLSLSLSLSLSFFLSLSMSGSLCLLLNIYRIYNMHIYIYAAHV